MVDVSILLKVHNSASTIRQTIASVRGQTYENFELIVIDDGSEDDTVDIVREIPDQRIRIYEYPYQGSSKSSNLGIEHAVGDFITFIDHDDLWLPDKIELQVQALKSTTTAGVAYCWTAMIDEEGKFLCAHNSVNFEGDISSDLVADCFIASGSNILVRRESIELVGGYDLQLSNGADWDFFVRLARHCHFIRIPSYQVLYRLLPNSHASVNIDKTARNLKAVSRKIIDSSSLSSEKYTPVAMSNIYHHLTFLCLSRKPDNEHMKKAGLFLLKSLRIRPRILSSLRFHMLLLNWMAIILLPRNSRLQVQRTLMKGYGCLQVITDERLQNLKLKILQIF